MTSATAITIQLNTYKTMTSAVVIQLIHTSILYIGASIQLRSSRCPSFLRYRRPRAAAEINLTNQYSIKYALLRFCSDFQFATFSPATYTMQYAKLKMYGNLPAQKGGDPHKRMYKITPALQTSISFP